MTDKFGNQGVRCSRYKKIITTTAAAETETTQAEIDKSIELEFWQNVKDSDNADMLRAYLEHYPNGKFKSLAEIKIKRVSEADDEVGISSTSILEESVNKIMNLWLLGIEAYDRELSGCSQPYTLILHLEQNGNSVSSLKVVELQTLEGHPL